MNQETIAASFRLLSFISVLLLLLRIGRHVSNWRIWYRDIMIKTGLVSVSFRNLSPRQIVNMVSKVDLDGIEWGGDKS